MSSVYPPSGAAPARPCQRCGISLPISEVFCKNCGYQNAPTSSSPNNFSQIPFPQQPDMRNGYAPSPQPMGNGGFYGPSGQPPFPGNNYGPMTGQIGQQPAFPQQSFQAGPPAPNMANRPPQVGGWNVPQTPPLPERRRPHIGRIIFVLLVLVATRLFFHAFALPLFEGPDEPFQLARAVAFADAPFRIAFAGDRVPGRVVSAIQAHPCGPDLKRTFGCAPFQRSGAFNALERSSEERCSR